MRTMRREKYIIRSGLLKCDMEGCYSSGGVAEMGNPIRRLCAVPLQAISPHVYSNTACVCLSISNGEKEADRFAIFLGGKSVSGRFRIGMLECITGRNYWKRLGLWRESRRTSMEFR